MVERWFATGNPRPTWRNHSFSERYKEVLRDAGQEEHRSKHNADEKGGHEGGRRDLRRTIQDNFVHVLLWFCLSVAIYALDLDCGVVHRDAAPQASPPSVMISIVSPIALSTMMEVRIARGMAVAMITGLRQLPRNVRIMKAVRPAQSVH
jgi:hypothetical protein